MPIDLEAVRRMARDSADREGVLTQFDRDLIGSARVRIELPLRCTKALAQHLKLLAGAVERGQAVLSYRTQDERASLLAVRGLVREANQKINSYRRIRTD